MARGRPARGSQCIANLAPHTRPAEVVARVHHQLRSLWARGGPRRSNGLARPHRPLEVRHPEQVGLGADYGG